MREINVNLKGKGCPHCVVKETQKTARTAQIEKYGDAYKERERLGEDYSDA